MFLLKEENLQKWNIVTAVVSLILYFTLYLTITFLSTYLETNSDAFHLIYEHYCVITIGFIFLISFTLECILIVISKSNSIKLWKYWLIAFGTSMSIHEIIILGSAIYIIIDGTDYIAYSLFGLFIVYLVPIGITIFITIKIYTSNLSNDTTSETNEQRHSV